jgi:hypothetical protein
MGAMLGSFLPRPLGLIPLTLPRHFLAAASPPPPRPWLDPFAPSLFEQLNNRPPWTLAKSRVMIYLEGWSCRAPQSRQ